MAPRLSRFARADIVAILEWSGAEFGEAAMDRYLALLEAAIRDISADPNRMGSSERPDLGEGVRVWHLRLSRHQSANGVVTSPRHFAVYRVAEDDAVVIGRVLHDAMDLARHIDDLTWES